MIPLLWPCSFISMMAHEQFQKTLSQTTGQQVSKQEAVEARHNLSGFMSLLIKINEREQIVPTRPEESNDPDQ